MTHMFSRIWMSHCPILCSCYCTTDRHLMQFLCMVLVPHTCTSLSFKIFCESLVCRDLPPLWQVLHLRSLKQGGSYIRINQTEGRVRALIIPSIKYELSHHFPQHTSLHHTQAPAAPGVYEVRYCPAWLSGSHTVHRHSTIWAVSQFTVSGI